MKKYGKHDAEKYEEGRKLSESTSQTTLPENVSEELPFNTMDYIDIRKDQRFKAATLKENIDDSNKALMITLRMLYENQKKILSNQEIIWMAINQPGPETVLKYDVAKAFDQIAHGLISAANKLY